MHGISGKQVKNQRSASLEWWADRCKNCVIDGAQGILSYAADHGPLQSGTHLGLLELENVRFTDFKASSAPMANEKEPLTILLKNVSVEFDSSAECKKPFAIAENANTTLIEQ